MLQAAPVGGGGAGEGKGRDVAGVGNVGTTAQVLPHHLAGLAVDVVVDGQLARTDLGIGAIGGPGHVLALSPISSSLYRSAASSARPRPR